MDKMVYIAASGAKQSLQGLALKANNLANANTTGFKADFAQARSMQAFGEGLPTRVFSMQERPGSNMTSGGIIETGHGRQVIGEGGPVILPVPIEKISFSEDGAIQVRPQGAPANFLEEVDTLRVVEGNSRELEKGNDGLFRPVPGQTVDTSANVKVLSGALEMSNVNPVHEMVDMINHQRQFELQVKLMKTAEEIDERQDQLMRIV